LDNQCSGDSTGGGLLAGSRLRDSENVLQSGGLEKQSLALKIGNRKRINKNLR
jgi:hypothetical protein